MTHLLLLALLSADLITGPDVGATDAPVLIDEHGSQSKILGVEPLPPGAVCLTHLKAASVRDDLAAKNSRIETLEAGSGIDWPLVGLVGAGGVAVGVVAGVLIGLFVVPRK